MKLSKLSVAVFAASAGVAGLAHAVETPLDQYGVSVSGHVAGGYTYQSAPTPASGFSGAQDQDSLKLHQAAVTIAKQPKEGLGFLINVTGGRDAGYIHAFPFPYTASSNNVGAQTTNREGEIDLTQAYAQYAKGKFTAMLGKFTTLAGAETISPVTNTNITRSIEFYTIPFTHTGARVAYAAADNLTLYVGANTGWDQVRDSNPGKTTELGFAWSPTDTVTLATQAYIGKDNYNGSNAPAAPGMASTRSLIDTVLTVKATKDLTLILNADHGKQNSASGNGEYTWAAYVGYANYQWTEKLRSSLRLETFHDKGNGNPTGSKVGLFDNNGNAVRRLNEATLTVGYSPVPSFELRGEVRQDWTAKKAYTDFDQNARRVATTAAIEGLYKF